MEAVTKRKDYINWDEYFMIIAKVSALRSKDPNTQVGACIVNPEKKIVGIGYNGFPNGCSDDEFPWARECMHNIPEDPNPINDPLETKYPYVVHAEVNAIINKNSSSLKDCTLYCSLFPCNECAKIIIQSGITKVIYAEDKYHDGWQWVAARKMFDAASVTYQQEVTSKQVTVV